jgi:hypothetical protein
LGQGDLVQVTITEGLRPGQVIALNPPDVKTDFTVKKKEGETNDAGVKR